MKIQPANRRLGVLLSGRGSNFEAIADRIASNKLDAEIAVVISNIESAPGLEHARTRSFNAVYIPSKNRPREEFDREAIEVLRKNNVSVVVLAGFMRILSRTFLDAFPYGILNIHPALLPSFREQTCRRKRSNTVLSSAAVRFTSWTTHWMEVQSFCRPQ
jgi:phosphoribosylglycinamide formyltransferase-1